jgi:hypothetical protein
MTARISSAIDTTLREVVDKICLAFPRMNVLPLDGHAYEMSIDGTLDLVELADVLGAYPDIDADVDTDGRDIIVHVSPLATTTTATPPTRISSHVVEAVRAHTAGMMKLSESDLRVIAYLTQLLNVSPDTVSVGGWGPDDRQMVVDYDVPRRTLDMATVQAILRVDVVSRVQLDVAGLLSVKFARQNNVRHSVYMQVKRKNGAISRTVRTINDPDAGSGDEPPAKRQRTQ